MKRSLFVGSHRTQLQATVFLNVSILVAAAASVGMALYMQHVQGLQPCTLCIIQRYAFIWVALCALLAILRPFGTNQLIAASLGILGAIGGMVAALRNLWVMAHPDILCGRDPVEIFLNSLPTAQWLPEVFIASGLCSSPIPPLLGLPLPAWSLIGLLGLAILFVFTFRQR